MIHDASFLHDVIVVGGGPAGLIASTYLARFRRSVILVDSAQSRAATIPRSHNYPGFADGISGTELIGSLRTQVARYDIKTISAVVTSLEIDPQGFSALGTDLKVSGRMVLLATGVRDVRPDLLYAGDAVRDGLLRYCPVCDGFEVIDQAVGVLVKDAVGIREAIYLRHFSDKVTVFPCGSGAQITNAEREELACRGIAVAMEPTDSLRMWNAQITVRHGAMETVCDAVYCALGTEVHSSMAAALGAALDDNGYLLIDEHHQTTVPGLYAAGDVARGLNQISVASGGATTAASAMHVVLGAHAPRSADAE